MRAASGLGSPRSRVSCACSDTSSPVSVRSSLALGVGHPARNVPLARREQHAQVVDAHALGRLERRRGVAVFGLQQREHGERR